jgi:8-oxo-dGTP pyrophosphatase MutT (NUDIX family)
MMNCYEALQHELKKPLPGKAYQMKMAPTGRFMPLSRAKKKVEAAVSIVLVENKTEDKIELILIKRTVYDGPHSGQISFPGGKSDHSDKSLFETAIRETDEEIGLKLNPGFYLGMLTPLHILVSGFEVHPFVFYYSGVPNFLTDKQEVQYIIKANIESLIDHSLIKDTKIIIGDMQIDTPCFDIAGEIVWGATSMILSEFVEILHRVKIKNPACF